MWFALGGMLLLLGISMVQAKPSTPTLTPQQLVYIDAQTAIRQGNRQKYWELRKQILDYPLLPYLERSYYTKFMRTLPASVVENFLLKHTKDDFIKNLQFRYLAFLSTRDTDKFTLWVEQTPNHWLNAQLQCRYLTLQRRAGVNFKVLDQQINQLWQHPTSQDKVCDPLFRWWKKQGGMTPDRILQRIKLVANKGKPRLIVYLTSLLPAELQPVGRVWGQVANSSGYISRIGSWRHLSPQYTQPVVMFGLRKLVWEDVNSALQTYINLPKNIELTQAQQFELVKTIAIRLALYDEDEAQVWLDKAFALGIAEDVRDWQISHYIRHAQWQSLVDFVQGLPPRYQADSRTQYWSAVAYGELGNTDQQHSLLSMLATERHYYGFKASDALNIPISLNQRDVPLNLPLIAAIKANPHFLMATEFLAIEKYALARYEWRRLLNELDDEQGAQAAVLAFDLGWYDRGIYALAEFGHLQDVAKRFPMPFEAEFSAQTMHPTSWLYAIARRESAFAPDARSRANARGLMQVLPRTANYLTNTKHTKAQLNDPAYNIQLGAQYLDYLSGKISDNRILRTAAYNAGWRNVQKWLPQTPMPMAHWIETIPFKETREYVKAILAYERIYAQQLSTRSAMTEAVEGFYVHAAILTANLETGTLSAK